MKRVFRKINKENLDINYTYMVLKVRNTYIFIKA
jgi:hypothetical protein